MKNNLKSSWAIYLYVLLALLPVLIFRDYTPSNELRYLSIADEALQNGTFFAFTNQGMPYADKPPLYLWIVMLGKWLLGEHHMWFLSLFSLIPAFVIIHIMDKWTKQELGTEYRLTAKLLLCSCGLFLGLAIVLRMDMLMCMFITLSLYTFYNLFKGEGSQDKYALLFPIYVFLAVFSKGPVGILVPLLCTIVFLLWSKRIRTIGRYWGWKTWGILLVACFLWFGAVYLEGGSSYLNNLLFHQTIDRAVNSFHHEEPFYYYLISVWYSLFPWSLLLIGMIIVAVCKKWIQSDLQKFFLSIIVTSFIMLSVISSKIAVYLLPIFPFVVYLAAMQFSRFQWNKWLALTIAFPALVFTLALPVFAGVARQENTLFLNQGCFYVATGILTLSGIGAFYLLYVSKKMKQTIQILVTGFFSAVFVGGWALPKINSEIGYGELCRTALKVAENHSISRYCVWKISRPENMDVYLQQDIQEVTQEEILAGKLHETVLLLPVKEMEKVKPMVSGKENYQVGPYNIVVL